MLEENGYDVRRLTLNNDEIVGVGKKVSTLLQTPWSIRGRRVVGSVLENDRPDIVHVHNFFPLFSPSIFKACRDHGVPVVMTCHNFRVLCPTATFVLNGRIDEGSLRRPALRLVPKRFFRNSLAGSLAVAAMVDFNKWRGTWVRDVSAFITLTKFAKSRFVAGGIPADKIFVKPNSISLKDYPKKDHSIEGGAVFVGRLSPEKGVDTLLAAWEKSEVPLTIIGEGRPADYGRIGPNVRFVGKQPPEAVRSHMRSASMLVMPSRCYEGFPMTLLEAYASGLPVIASRIGSLEELVENNHTGLLFPVGDSDALRKCVVSLARDPGMASRLAANGRRLVETAFSPPANLARLASIYQSVIEAT